MPFAAPEGTELFEPLGVGTVFEVALVREAGLTLVCKRLTPRAVREPAGRAAIVREAKVLALAHHPALPSLVRVGTDGRGPFLLETRADGVSMRELVQGWRYRRRGVPPRLVGHVAVAALEALAEIHELADDAGPLGIVHGDLGPDHLVLGPLGQIRFVDFGAARWRDMEPQLATDDRGTLPYVAPEVARGESVPDQTSDVYGLAATLAFLASGQPPATARDEAAMLLEIGSRGIDPAFFDTCEGLDARARDALAAAVRREPGERLATARALLAAFQD